MARRTPEQVNKLMEKIAQANASGAMTIAEACEKYGTYYSQFYKWKKRNLESGPTKVETYDASENQPVRKHKKKQQTTGRLVALVGSADEVMAALRGL